MEEMLINYMSNLKKLKKLNKFKLLTNQKIKNAKKKS